MHFEQTLVSGTVLGSRGWILMLGFFTFGQQVSRTGSFGYGFFLGAFLDLGDMIIVWGRDGSIAIFLI